MKRVVLGLAIALALAWVIISVIVEREGTPRLEHLGGGTGKGKALVLYHPSRDARFSDELSLAFAEGLMAAGFAVDRGTLTSETPAHPEGYAIIGVVSNTYYWTPDLPTMHYLSRARMEGLPVVGLIGGAGSTGRSQRVLEAALRRTGATVIDVRSFWLWRPNDETRLAEPNRQVALDRARQLGNASGAQILAPSTATP
jgi:hypothetical protein